MAVTTGDELRRFETMVTLKDGANLRLRAVRQQDEDNLLRLFYSLSGSAVNLRFHNILFKVSRDEARRFSAVDYHDSFALVATMGEGPEEKIVGVGRFVRLVRQDAAEVIFVVDGACQGRGIGTLLIDRLANAARTKGINVFEAEVMADNTEMMEVFEKTGFKLERQLSQDSYRVSLEIVPTAVAEELSAEREKVATIASLKGLLAPRSIAVIGASRRPGSIGNKVFHNLLYQEFEGIVYPVNPNAAAVASVKAYPTVLDIPDEVDKAVIIVPAALVLDAVEQCGRKGVKGVVVISSGFGESGPEGIERQRKLVDILVSYGMREVGPNCMGIINTDPGVNMNATFSSVFPKPGNIAFATQSGALGLAILEYARALNVGLSTFVSIGNMADVSGLDLIQYWEEDPVTKVILLYLESFGHPRKFARIARRVTSKKPIIAVKSGRTPAGSRAAASHTGALATTEVAVQALFTQAGIIRVDTLEELFDVANLLSHQPIPAGKKVAILTNGGGPGILTADACSSRGLDLPPVPAEMTSLLRTFMPAGANLTNPIDMTAEASASQYRRALEMLGASSEFDIVIVIFIPPILTEAESVSAAIRDVAPAFRAKGKTLIASFISARGAPADLGSEKDGYVPAFNFPEATASALASAYAYGQWLKRPQGAIPALSGIDKDRAETLVKSVRANSPHGLIWLEAGAVAELLRCYGISSAPAQEAATGEAAVAAAREVGFPVAVKLLSQTISHKSDVGGVFLDLHTDKQVEGAFQGIRDRLAALGKEKEMQGVVVQPMIQTGVEVIVGVTQDKAFGPLVMFGLGGVQAELFKDVNFRIHPLTDVDAAEMVRGVKAYQLLQGWRGAPPSDTKSIEDLLLRVSAMVEDLSQIGELDLNPVKVFEDGKGYAVLDARIMLS